MQNHLIHHPAEFSWSQILTSQLIICPPLLSWILKQWKTKTVLVFPAPTPRPKLVVLDGLSYFKMENQEQGKISISQAYVTPDNYLIKSFPQAKSFRLWFDSVLCVFHTFSKCCWRLFSTCIRADNWLDGGFGVILCGVPISSFASAPKNTRSSKSPTVRTYSSYSRFMALLDSHTWIHVHMLIFHTVLGKGLRKYYNNYKW